MNPGLFDASVPVFERYLERATNMLSVSEQHCSRHRQEPARLLESRLAPDMAPFHEQVAMAANFSLRAAYPLAGRAIPTYGEYPPNIDGLRRRLSTVGSLLAELNPQEFVGAELRTLESQAGHALVSLPASAFLFSYALPNFFFHLTTAYALLRSKGVALGKGDFDGFHRYARSP